VTAVYLEKLKLKGFRSYRSEREINFTPGPGLTVIVGPNGLGKSTLFDAVEWGLTGELRRLNASEGKAADKKAALGVKPDVQLWFSDAAHIRRTLSKETITNVNAANIKDWLTAEKWRGVNSIADCLQLTHFLGQSSRQMFVHLDGKKRWGLLEGPAGLQSLWKVESTLGRRQTDFGFDRVQEDFLREETTLLAELSNIQVMREKLNSTRELERADEILPPDEVMSRCQRIVDELANESQGIAVSELPSTDQRTDADSLLQSQRVMLEAAEQELKNQRDQLAPWWELSQNYSTNLAKAMLLNQEKELSLHEVRGAEAAAEKMELELMLLRSEHQGLVEKNSAEIASRDAVIAEIERGRRVAAGEERLKALLQNSSDLSAKRDGHNLQLLASKATLQSFELTRSRHLELTQRGSALKSLSIQAEELLKEDAVRRNAQLEIISIPASENIFRAAIGEQRQALDVLTNEEGSLKLQKDAEVSASNSISAGVAQIASALQDEDCACPVCSTTFAISGQLKELATQQANLSNARLAKLELKISQKSKQIRAANEKMSESLLRVGRLLEKKELLKASIASADQLENSLRGNPLLASIDINEFLPTLALSIGQNNSEINALAAKLSSFPDMISMRSEIQQLEHRLHGVLAEIDKIVFTRGSLEREIEQLRSLPSLGRSSEDLEKSIIKYEISLHRQTKILSDSQAKLSTNEVNETALNVQLEGRRKMLSSINAQISALQLSSKELEDRWVRQGFSDLPLPLAIQEIDESYTRKSIRLLRISQEHGVILNGYRRYLAHAELQRLEISLKNECEKYQMDDIDRVVVKLVADLAVLKKKQNGLLMVQKKRSELLSQLKKKASDIRNTVSVPLNSNTERFCAALMSDRSHQVSLNAIANATTAQALLSFQPDGQDVPKDPLLYMSEGQLAATSLCLLFGASATYPWSRWKSLLMDDPLHHNDSVHAAAFIDVVRNLIRSQGYQIIVSTHDMEQAGYFLRKCRNAGITAQYLHLYGREDDGTALLQTA
jgi:DNA repair exonuclease SbcCD ATPase subunit